mmetsp:Transcript_41775/g.130843  ORF Transcript_41775/g.130843 Transcript_41775/m.130843 type:complete len:241 (-) Transcript_41775:106-828(-)|eukprot:CAMPEP_0118874120 /NCGR_PEP_ID=MMETSP1163-20130328/15682_1 /TAXON_ID=124430 /ORGANISM="Phaeomonas parva, Strain CCMP2877" /LENGTH=240 /DNA_ID=CAMNT_0006809475 /DNA_START=139 /DNA_END=861 /DNA_ORIENTATION=+
MVEVGVLALQGAFEEHIEQLEQLGVAGRQVRTAAELEGIDGLIMPGGESSAMALVGEADGFWPDLKAFVQSGKPVWGTCAGMILLSDTALAQKRGGQALVGGLDVKVCRNYFGAQISSMEAAFDCSVDAEGAPTEKDSCTGVFIRAPAILEAGEGVQVMASLVAAPCAKAARQLANEERVTAVEPAAKKPKVVGEAREVIVAVRQGHILATAFHPELTEDLRWLKYFLGMVRAGNSAQGA